jgi:hypothetical protein
MQMELNFDRIYPPTRLLRAGRIYKMEKRMWHQK